MIASENPDEEDAGGVNQPLTPATAVRPVGQGWQVFDEFNALSATTRSRLRFVLSRRFSHLQLIPTVLSATWEPARI